MRITMTMALIGSCAFLAGCPTTTPPPPTPAEAVLEGEWTGTAEDGMEYTFTFDANGKLTQVQTTLADGSVVTATVTNSTSSVDGDDVSVEVVRDNQTATFTGMFVDNQNGIDGEVSREIAVGDNVTITLPAGPLDLVRVGADPCEGVTCEEGEECVDGTCVAMDPCEGVTCDEGQECVDGECVAADPCEGVTCEDGQECVDGECVAADPCEGVTCEEGEECVDGLCVPTIGMGDAVNGEAVYASTCMVCHGVDATGGIGPNIQGASAAEIASATNGEGGHPPYPAVSAQDILDLEAYLGSF